MMGFSREQQRLVWEWTAKAPQKGRRQGPFILKAGGSGRGGATLGRTGFSGAQNAHFLMAFGSRAAEGSDRPGSGHLAGMEGAYLILENAFHFREKSMSPRQVLRGKNSMVAMQ